MYMTGKILFVTFKKGAGRDTESCLDFLKQTILLSNFFKEELDKKRSPGKKFNKTTRIRTGVQELVDKTNTSQGMVNDLISFIRKGQIEEIKTSLNDIEIRVNKETNFDKLLVDILIKETVTHI